MTQSRQLHANQYVGLTLSGQQCCDCMSYPCVCTPGTNHVYISKSGFRAFWQSSPELSALSLLQITSCIARQTSGPTPGQRYNVISNRSVTEIWTAIHVSLHSLPCSACTCFSSRIGSFAILSVKSRSASGRLRLPPGTQFDASETA